MATFDWVVLAVLLGSLALGVWRGLVYEFASTLGWVAAFVLAPWFAPALAARLPMDGTAESVRYAAGFVLVFIAIAFAGGLLATLARTLVTAAGLRPVDRALGAAFGLARGVLLLLAMAMVMNLTSLKSSRWWRVSTAAAVGTVVLHRLKPVLPVEFGSYLP